MGTSLSTGYRLHCVFCGHDVPIARAGRCPRCGGILFREIDVEGPTAPRPVEAVRIQTRAPVLSKA